MADLARWQPSYYMVAVSGSTTSVPTAAPNFATGKGTYGASKSIVYVSNEPTFDINQEIISSRKATGRAYLIKGNSAIERFVGVEAPTTTFEADFDAAAAFIPFYTLFQDGTGTITGSTYNKVFNVYSSSSVQRFAHLLRELEGEEDQCIKSAIAQSITVSGEEKGEVKLSVDWLGSDFVTSGYTVPTWGTGHCQTMTMFRDVKCKFNSTGATDGLIDIVGFDVTIKNNAVPKYYNNATVQKYVLGDLEVTGTLRFPWGETNVTPAVLFDDLTGGTDFKLTIYKGADLSETSATAAGDWTIILNVEVDDVKTNPDDELTNEVTFTGIYAEGIEGSMVDPVTVYLYDGVDRSTY